MVLRKRLELLQGIPVHANQVGAKTDPLQFARLRIILDPRPKTKKMSSKRLASLYRTPSPTNGNLLHYETTLDNDFVARRYHSKKIPANHYGFQSRGRSRRHFVGLKDNQLKLNRSLKKRDHRLLQYTVQGKRDYAPDPKHPSIFDRIGSMPVTKDVTGNMSLIDYENARKLETLEEDRKLQGLNMYKDSAPKHMDHCAAEEVTEVIKKEKAVGVTDMPGPGRAGTARGGTAQVAREGRAYKAGNKPQEVFAVEPMDNDSDLEDCEDNPDLKVEAFAVKEPIETKEEKPATGDVSAKKLDNLMMANQEVDDEDPDKLGLTFGKLRQSRRYNSKYFSSRGKRKRSKTPAFQRPH